MKTYFIPFLLIISTFGCEDSTSADSSDVSLTIDGVEYTMYDESISGVSENCGVVITEFSFRNSESAPSFKVQLSSLGDGTIIRFNIFDLTSGRAFALPDFFPIATLSERRFEKTPNSLKLLLNGTVYEVGGNQIKSFKFYLKRYVLQTTLCTSDLPSSSFAINNNSLVGVEIIKQTGLSGETVFVFSENGYLLIWGSSEPFNSLNEGNYMITSQTQPSLRIMKYKGELKSTAARSFNPNDWDQYTVNSGNLSIVPSNGNFTNGTFNCQFSLGGTSQIFELSQGLFSF